MEVWDVHLPYVLMTYRAHIHGSITCTPNLIMLGGELSLPLDLVAVPMQI